MVDTTVLEAVAKSVRVRVSPGAPYKNTLVALTSNCIEDCGILNIQSTKKSEKQIGNDLPSVRLRQTDSLVCFYMVSGYHFP
jgi:hypothetical protein